MTTFDHVTMTTRTFGRYYSAGMPKSSMQRLVREVSGVTGATRRQQYSASTKRALFEAVFERVETDASKSINKALRGKRDPWEKAQAGLAAFLEIVRQPRYRRIVIQEGPAVLGYERFREQEERSTFGSVLDIVRAVLGAGEWELDEGMLQTFARIFFGAMSSAGETVATAENPELAAWRVEAAIGFMITGFRTLADSGIDLPTAPGTDGTHESAGQG
jgi:AcrR family transcriptional regulator